jgi:hypothetical protein
MDALMIKGGMGMRRTRVFDLLEFGELGDAGQRGGAAKLMTHGEATGTRLSFQLMNNQGTLRSLDMTGTQLGNQFQGRFTSMELLACYPGKGQFGQSFATASRTATRAPTGVILWDGSRIQAGALLTDRIPMGTWSLQRGTTMLTFYPNRLLTGFVRLFGY